MFFFAYLKHSDTQRKQKLEMRKEVMKMEEYKVRFSRNEDEVFISGDFYVLLLFFILFGNSVIVASSDNHDIAIAVTTVAPVF